MVEADRIAQDERRFRHAPVGKVLSVHIASLHPVQYDDGQPTQTSNRPITASREQKKIRIRDGHHRYYREVDAIGEEGTILVRKVYSIRERRRRLRQGLPT